jgi:hypothetical protein
LLTTKQLHHEIAGYLENDTDIIHYAATCRETFAAINDNDSTFWRKRHTEVFTPIKGVSNSYLKENYYDRRKWLRKGVIFYAGTRPTEVNCLKMLKGLICGTYSW